MFLLDLSTMSNTSSLHETYSFTLAAADSTSSYLSDTSSIKNPSRARNSSCPPLALGEAYTGSPEATSRTETTWGMFGDSYILSWLTDERPTDPGVERMLEDFEKSEIEDWKFNMVQFSHVYESQWMEPYDEADQYGVVFSDGAIMSLIVEEFQERSLDEALLDEALLDDFERYEKEEEEFWMMRGVAHMYGMWDEEYWHTWWRGPWWESTYHSWREEIEANSLLLAERRWDTRKPVEEDQTHEVLWWEQMRKQVENGTLSVIFWRELPGLLSQCTEPWKLIHEEMSPGLPKATQCPVNYP